MLVVCDCRLDISSAATTTDAASMSFAPRPSAITSSSKTRMFNCDQATPTGTRKFSAQEKGQGQSAPTFGNFGKAKASGFMLGSQQTAAASICIGFGGGAFSTFNSSTVAPAFGSTSSKEGE